MCPKPQSEDLELHLSSLCACTCICHSHAGVKAALRGAGKWCKRNSLSFQRNSLQNIRQKELSKNVPRDSEFKSMYSYKIWKQVTLPLSSGTFIL